MAVSHALQTALSGLMIQSRGLDITGHNIANASTDGYSRQRPEMSAALATKYPWGSMGNGVQITNIERVVDEFLHTQQRESLSLFKSDETLDKAYTRIEAVFNELSDNDLSTSIDKFFNSLHDLSINVEAEATRSLIVQQALSLRDIVSVTSTSLRDYYTQLNNDVAGQVSEINELIDEIADLNRQVSVSEGGETTANDLRDTRDRLLSHLAELVDITTYEQPNGAMNVTIRGMPLVLQTRSFHLEAHQEISSSGLPTVNVRFEEDHAPFMAREGTLAATLETRDQVLASYMRDLDQLAAEFIFEFNRVHVQGVGAAPRTSVTSEGAAVDPAVTLDQIDLGFTPVAGTFEIGNGSLTIAIVSLGSGQIDEITVPIDLDGGGAPDDTLNSFIANFNAAVPAGTIVASLDATGHLNFDSQNPAATGFYFTNDSSGLLATMGVNTFWAGHSAATMDVNADVLADERLLATGKTIAPGDNDNLLEMISLRDADSADGSTKTFEEFYRTIIGRMGTEGRRANDSMLVRNDLVMRLEHQREAISGVSLDEEMTKMIQFQRAYQAAARLISISDTMLDTLINRM
jgi:flagellar hook-associated protein 1